MDVLVVGGTGFIGQHLCEVLFDRGHEVTALARDPEAGSLPDGVTTLTGDVTAYDSIESAFAGRDVAVNLVALSPLFKPRGGGEMYDRINREGTQHCVRAAEEHGVERFVQMSGIGADPGSASNFLRTKGEAEQLVRSSDMEWVIYRPTIVFGDGCEFVDFIRFVTTPIVTGLPGGGRVQYQPIWVGDLAPMLAAGVTDDDRAGECYELGGPERLTLAEATKAIYRAGNRSVRILPIPMPIAKVGLRLVDPLPFIPMGTDQAKSIDTDLVVTENDIEAFSVNQDDMTKFREWLHQAETEAY